MAGRADADARERARRDAGCFRRLPERLSDRLDDIFGTVVRRGRSAGLRDDRVAFVDDNRLDLRATEVDAGSHNRFLAAIDLGGALGLCLPPPALRPRRTGRPGLLD